MPGYQKDISLGNILEGSEKFLSFSGIWKTPIITILTSWNSYLNLLDTVMAGMRSAVCCWKENTDTSQMSFPQSYADIYMG